MGLLQHMRRIVGRRVALRNQFRSTRALPPILEADRVFGNLNCELFSIWAMCNPPSYIFIGIKRVYGRFLCCIVLNRVVCYVKLRFKHYT